MVRLMLFAVFLMLLAAGVLALLAVFAWMGGSGSSQEETTVSDNVRRVAYVVLIVLMFGVTSGALGAG